METIATPETVSLWRLWRDHRETSKPFGIVCAMAREGRIPGAVHLHRGTPEILKQATADALAAMRKEAV